LPVPEIVHADDHRSNWPSFSRHTADLILPAPNGMLNADRKDLAESKVIRKVDLTLMPILTMTFGLQVGFLPPSTTSLYTDAYVSIMTKQFSAMQQYLVFLPIWCVQLSPRPIVLNDRI